MMRIHDYTEPTIHQYHQVSAEPLANGQLDIEGHGFGFDGMKMKALDFILLTIDGQTVRYRFSYVEYAQRPDNHFYGTAHIAPEGGDV